MLSGFAFWALRRFLEPYFDNLDKAALEVRQKKTYLRSVRKNSAL
jgi:hypothetical protein